MVFGLAAAFQVLAVSGGSLTGTIRDQATNVPIASATITLATLGRKTVSDSAGSYRFPGLPPGPQDVVIRRLGYGFRTFRAIIPAGDELRIDIGLEALPVTLGPR
jgi:Carboxypeptidase regulatory-like domain